MAMQWWHLINYRFKSKKSISCHFEEIPQYPDNFKRLNFNKLSDDDQVKLRNCYLAALCVFRGQPSIRKLAIGNLKKNIIPADELPIRLPLLHAYNKKEGDIITYRDINFCIQLILLGYINCNLYYPGRLYIYFTSNYDMYIKTPKVLDEDDIKMIERRGFYIKKCEPLNISKI